VIAAVVHYSGTRQEINAKFVSALLVINVAEWASTLGARGAE